MRLCFLFLLSFFTFPALADVANIPDPVDVNTCTLTLTTVLILFVFILTSIALLFFHKKDKTNKKIIIFIFIFIVIVSYLVLAISGSFCEKELDDRVNLCHSVCRGTSFDVMMSKEEEIACGACRFEYHNSLRGKIIDMLLWE